MNARDPWGWVGNEQDEEGMLDLATGFVPGGMLLDEPFQGAVLDAIERMRNTGGRVLPPACCEGNSRQVRC